MEVTSFLKGLYVGKKISDINHHRSVLNERKILEKCRGIEIISAISCVCSAICLLYVYDANKIISNLSKKEENLPNPSPVSNEHSKNKKGG